MVLMAKIPDDYQRWSLYGILGMFLLALPLMVWGLMSGRVETRGRAAEEAAPNGCQDLPPSLPTSLTATNGTKAGEVILSWDQDLTVDYYALVFGQNIGSYQFGLANIGNVGQYTMKQLLPGKRYYFAIVAVRGCASSGLSQEVSALAAGPTTVPSPTPTISLYQPADEILSVLAPASTLEVWPTLPPLPVSASPEESQTNLLESQSLFYALLILIAGAFLYFFLFLVRKILPPPPPRIVLPPSLTSRLRPINFSQREKSHRHPS